MTIFFILLTIFLSSSFVSCADRLLRPSNANSTTTSANVHDLPNNLSRSFPSSTSSTNSLHTDLIIEPIKHSGEGQYLIQIGVGRPEQNLKVILDTGSDLSWVMCEPCPNCFWADTIFNRSASRSDVRISCTERSCMQLPSEPQCSRVGDCKYEEHYASREKTSGELMWEDVTFYESQDTYRFIMGCSYDAVGKYSKASGMIGLDAGPLSLPSQLNANYFSFCLVRRYSSEIDTFIIGWGSSLVGEFKLDQGGLSLPLLRSWRYPRFYYLGGMTGITVGDKRLEFGIEEFSMNDNGEGGVIVDSGTPITRLPPKVYKSLRDAFVARVSSTKPMPRVFMEGDILDTCYDLSQVLSDSSSTYSVPPISFHFVGGEKNTIKLPLNNYFTRMDLNDQVYCLPFSTSTATYSVLGNVQMQCIRFTFDLLHSKLHLIPNDCKQTS